MAFIRPSVSLRMAAVVLAMSPEPITACEAISQVVPPTPEGTESWWSAKAWLDFLLPETGFECDKGWWRMEDREARLLGVMLAGDMAEEAGD